MPEITDILDRYAKTGDLSAFAELVRSHVDLVYSVALRQVYGDTHLAQEVAQEVFVILAQKAGSLAGRPTLNGWFYQTTLWQANSAIRHEQRRRLRDHKAYLEAAPMNNEPSSSAPDWSGTRTALDQAIGQLTDRERDAVLLRFFENQSFPEIGRRLRLSDSAARMRIERSLDKLRRILAKAGTASTAAELAKILAEQGATAAPAGLAGSVSTMILPIWAGQTASGSFLTFMTTTKALVGLGGLLLLPVGAAVYETAEANWIGREVALATHTVNRLEAQLQPSRNNAVGNATVSRPRTEPSVAATTNGSRNSALYRRFIADPSFQREWISSQMAQLRLRAQPLSVVPPFSAEKLNHFLGLMEKSSWNDLDLHVAALELGLPDNDPALRAASWENKWEALNQVRLELGLPTMASLQKYTRLIELPEEVVQTVAAASYDTDHPLTVDQANQLREAASFNIHDQGAFFAQAQSILTPAQMSAVRAFDQQFQFKKALAAAQKGNPRL